MQRGLGTRTSKVSICSESSATKHRGKYTTVRPLVRTERTTLSFNLTLESPLVRCCERELGRSEANLAVGDVEDIVETLEECHAIDEVEAGPARHPEVVHDEIYEVRRAADGRVELLRRTTGRVSAGAVPSSGTGRENVLRVARFARSV